MPDASAPTATELFSVEDRLIELYALRKSAGFATDDIEEAYGAVTLSLYTAGLVAKGLPAGKNDPEEDDSIPDDGIHTTSGTKSGKGGEKHRFQAALLDGEVGGEDGDEDNTGHTNVVPGAKAKRNKSPDGEGRTVAKAGPPPAETKTAQKPQGGATATAVNPGAGAPAAETNGPKSAPPEAETTYVPHPFAPSPYIRSICETCGYPIADHVGKFIGSDDSWDLAAYVVKEFTRELTVDGKVDPTATVLFKRDFTTQERQQFAGNGVALPDGSFPIPDEASLHNAIRLVGHAQDPQSAMQHIIERSKSMGMVHALPPAWNVADAGEEQEPGYAGGAHAQAPGQAPGQSPGGGASKPGGAAGGTGPAKPPAPKPSSGGMMKSIAIAFQKGLDAGLGADTILETLDAVTADTFEQYVVLKADEKRYTQGPVYMPEQYDAHGEWTTADELQKSLWEYVRETGADRRIYLQHTSRPAGEWVEAFQWHFPVKAKMIKSINGVQKSVSVDLPAGTTYLGVIWEPWAYEDVKKEKITGFSMGGWAKRLELALDSAR